MIVLKSQLQWGLMLGLLVIGLTLAATGVFAQSPDQQAGLDFVPGELLIKFRATTSSTTRQAALQRVGARTLSVLPVGGVLRVQVKPGQEQAAQAALSARPDVEYADLNIILTTQQTPNDPSFLFLWGLHNTTQSGGIDDADIDAPEAWDIHTGAANVIIADVDTGIDLSHPDLAGRLWVNAGEIPNNNIDDDGNGKIDDVNGWDFCNTSGVTRCGGGQDNNPDDQFGHGTHVAGIAAATGNNGIGVTGVSWGATLMAVKVLDSTGRGTVASVAGGIDYAVANGADIINLSLAAGGTLYPCSTLTTLNQAIQRAAAQGVLITGASGNYSTPAVACPAALDEVIAVGATDQSDVRRSSSNYGPRLDVVAPGESIYSTYFRDSYAYLSGNSMSAAYVTGLAALLESCSPALTALETRSIIESTTDDLGPVGRDDEYGQGRINAYTAVQTLDKLQPETSQINLFVADNSPGLPHVSSLSLIAGTSTPISWTATVSPTSGWLGLGAIGAGQISGVSPNLSVPLVITKPYPAVPGAYTASITIASERVGGLPLCNKSVDISLNYIPQADLVYFPLVLKDYTARPDLVVTSLTASSSGVTVTVKNQGDASVVDAFWVDVYFNPVVTPALNTPWPQIAAHGQVWGVTSPLAPGESLTLVTGGGYYFAQYSSVVPLPVGAEVFALADSINYSTSYGSVLERDESNNLSGKTVSAAGVTRLRTTVISVEPGVLPARQK